MIVQWYSRPSDIVLWSVESLYYNSHYMWRQDSSRPNIVLLGRCPRVSTLSVWTLSCHRNTPQPLVAVAINFWEIELESSYFNFEFFRSPCPVNEPRRRRYITSLPLAISYKFIHILIINTLAHAFTVQCTLSIQYGVVAQFGTNLAKELHTCARYSFALHPFPHRCPS